MSKVGVFTLTRDRVDATMATLDSMRASRPGHAYHHWFFDNGSEDDTLARLRQLEDHDRVYRVIPLGENKGLHVAMNIAHRVMLDAGYDYIMKVDNDCEFKTQKWLRKLLRAQRALGHGAVVSPRVLGLRHPPEVFGKKRADGFEFSFLDIIGGITRLMPRKSIADFTFNERMPLAWGGDATFANHCAQNKIAMAYVEDVTVRHVYSDDDLADAMPAYAARKRYESYIPYGL